MNHTPSLTTQTFSLSSQNIPNVGNANETFGNDSTLLVARPGRTRCQLFWFTIPEGFYALVSRHGADVDYEDGAPVWPPGLHIGPPWLKVSHLVTMQSMVLQTPIKGCKTKDNVTVGIDMALVLRVMGEKDREGDDPKNVRKFVHMVTAMGLQQQLQDAQAEAVRTLARSVTHTEVFGLRNVSSLELQGVTDKLNKNSVPASAPSTVSFDDEIAEPMSYISLIGEEDVVSDDLQEQKDCIGDHDEDDELEADLAVERGASVTELMKRRLNQQFQPQGVEIIDVIIENISLPKEIQSQMSQKTMVISQNAEQRMQQKHDLLVLEQNEAVITLKQSHQEQKLEMMKDGRQKANLLNLELDHERALGNSCLKQIGTKMIVDVSLTISESDLKVQRIYDTTQLESERILLEAEEKCTRLYSNTLAETQDVEAKADLKCAQLQTIGDKAIFKAEGEIAPKMKQYNDHYTNMQKIGVQESLSKNDKLVVTGISGGEAANRLVMADAALSAVKEKYLDQNNEKSSKKLSSAERSSLLSELGIASGNAQVRINVGNDNTV